MCSAKLAAEKLNYRCINVADSVRLERISYLASNDNPLRLLNWSIHYINIMLNIVLDLFKLYDVSEAGCASVIRCKEGKGSYEVGPTRRTHS
jgi:hypothetical protein